HCLTASNAASRKTGRPLTNCRLVALPSLLTTNCTVTLPLRRRALAMGGYSGATLLVTCTGSRSDCEIMEGVDEATGFVKDVRAAGAALVLTLRTGAASELAGALSELAILDVPAETATAAGVRFSGGAETGAGAGGGTFFAALLSGLLLSAALTSVAGLPAALGAGAVLPEPAADVNG